VLARRVALYRAGLIYVPYRWSDVGRATAGHMTTSVSGLRSLRGDVNFRAGRFCDLGRRGFVCGRTDGADVGLTD